MDSSWDYRISKMPVKAVPKEQARNLTFLKRKRGLTKKVEELTVLCGIDACMVCFPPSQNKKRRCDSSSSASFFAPPSLEVWPETGRVLEVVKKYISLPREDQEKKKLDNSGFLSAKINKVSAELSKRRKKNRDLEKQMMGPSMELFLSRLSQNQLNDLLKDIDAKIEATYHRIQTLKKQEEESLLSTPHNVLKSHAISEGIQNWNSNSKQQEPFIEQKKCDIPDVCVVPATVSELGFPGERHHGSRSSSNDQLNVCRCGECLVNELLAESADVTLAEDTDHLIMNNRLSSIAEW